MRVKGDRNDVLVVDARLRVSETAVIGGRPSDKFFYYLNQVNY